MRPLALALLALLAVSVAVPGALGYTGVPLIANVTGPAGIAPAQSAHYNVTISGGPGGNVSYAVSWYVTGANTSGASPLAASPGSASGNKTTYPLNVTSPGVAEDIRLVVTVVATPVGGTPVNTTVTYTIVVVRPVVLSATFHNGGTTAAVNVTVSWYVDHLLVGTSTIRQIAANGDATVTYDYLPVGLSAGEHTVTVTADLDHDGVINPARGEVATSTLFYNQATPPAPGWIILIAMGVFLPVFLGVVAYRRRGQR